MANNTIKLGLIGAGFVAGQHMNAINGHPKAQAVGLTSRSRDKADTFAKEYNIPHVYGAITELVEQAKPDALMVMVSPNNMFSVCREALSFGLPVFMEKPAGLTPELNLELAEIADKNGIKTMVGYNRRFYSIFRKGMEIIRKNGPLYGILVEGHERIASVHASGRFSDDTIANWIYANGTHTIDLLRFFGGEITKVKANASRWQEAGGDQFSATIEFRNGAIGTYVSNWLSPGGWRAVLYGKGVSVEFNPLEKGIWTDSKFKTHEIDPDPEDEKYKPGFYGQLDCFCRLVSGQNVDNFQNLRTSLQTMKLAQSIASTPKNYR